MLPFRLPTLITAAVLAIVVSAPQLSEPGAVGVEDIPDGTVTMRVKERLARDPGIGADKVDAHTRNGVVLLTGTVDSLLARGLAERKAGMLKGVRAVVNRLEVDPAPLGDTKITADVIEALKDDPAADVSELSVTAEEGRVRLAGKVDSWQEEQLCVSAVKGVRGVRAVDSQIAVATQSKRPDAEIGAEIRRRLAGSVWIDAGLVDVDVVRGHALLSGLVGSLEEIRRAEEMAWVAGVVTVDSSGLQIDWALHDPDRRDRRYPVLSNSEIREALETALKYDPYVSAEHVSVEVSEGIVTLNGRVDSLRGFRAAEEDAYNTTGVWRVDNRLRIDAWIGPAGGPRPSLDREIARSVRMALARDPHVYQDKITVSVDTNVARLTGAVESPYIRNRAETVAASVRGVAEVINDLSLSADWRPKADDLITADVRSGLQWSPFVDSDDIIVQTSEGAVTLIGVVDSLRERRIATENALDAGAREVRNRLKVRHGPRQLQP